MKARTKDWIKFTLVMLVFLIGMIFLMIKHVEQVWIWILYITAWILAEMRIAKNIHLSWWTWVIIITGIIGIDIAVISLLKIL